MNETEREVYRELREAEDTRDVIEAVENFQGRQKTPVGQALVSAAGTMIGSTLSKNNE